MKNGRAAALALLAAIVWSHPLFAQSDPGIEPDRPDTGTDIHTRGHIDSTTASTRTRSYQPQKICGRVDKVLASV